MKTNILVGVLCCVITFLLVKSCQKQPDPLENPQTTHHLDTIRALKGTVQTLKDQLQTILEKRTSDSLKSEARIKRKNAEIRAKENSIAELRVKNDSLIKSMPEIDAIIDGQQGIITDLKAENDSLHQDLITERDSFKQFRVKVDEVNARTDELIAEYVKLNDALLTDNFKLRKENRKPKFIRGMLVGVLTTVGIYVAVNQLVE